MEADDIFLHGRNRQVLDHQTLTSKYLIWTLYDIDRWCLKLVIVVLNIPCSISMYAWRSAEQASLLPPPAEWSDDSAHGRHSWTPNGFAAAGHKQRTHIFTFTHRDVLTSRLVVEYFLLSYKTYFYAFMQEFYYLTDSWFIYDITLIHLTSSH